MDCSLSAELIDYQALKIALRRFYNGNTREILRISIKYDLKYINDIFTNLFWIINDSLGFTT